MDRPSELTRNEQGYFLMGEMLYQKFELVVEDELTADPDDGGGGSSGPTPGQGTQAERELWQDPEKRERIQKPYQ